MPRRALLRPAAVTDAKALGAGAMLLLADCGKGPEDLEWIVRVFGIETHEVHDYMEQLTGIRIEDQVVFRTAADKDGVECDMVKGGWRKDDIGLALLIRAIDLTADHDWRHIPRSMRIGDRNEARRLADTIAFAG